MVSGIGPEKPQPTRIKLVSFAKFPIVPGRGPVNPSLYDKSLEPKKKKKKKEDQV